MSEPARKGDYLVVSADTVAGRDCAAFAFVAFFVGAAVGAVGLHTAQASQTTKPLPAAIYKLGEYFCDKFDGLASVQPTLRDHYTFRCRELAVLPDVHIAVE